MAARTWQSDHGRFSLRFLGALIMTLAFVLTSCSGDAPLPGEPLRIANNDLPDAVIGEAYRVDLVAVGGLRPYDIRLREGQLPPGIALQDGVLVGTPTQLGDFSITLVASDGNLSSTFADFVITVRDVPLPILRITVPDTEVEGATVLRGRIEDARDLQGIRVRLTWQDPALRLAEDSVERSLANAALFSESTDTSLAMDLVALGDGFSGDAEVFRFALDAAEATRIGFDLDVEFLYADRHTFVTRRVGAAPPEPTNDEPPADVSDAATSEDTDGSAP